MPPPDLRVVAELCELALAARRLGCRIRVVDCEPELRLLIRLTGLGDVLLGEPARRRGPDDRS